MKKIINKLLTLNLKSAHNLDGVTVAGNLLEVNELDSASGELKVCQ